MTTQAEIHDLKNYLVDDFYIATRAEQRTDELYYHDTFDVPTLIQPSRIQRTGRASRMIDSPSEHIITSNPEAFRVLPDNEAGKKKAMAVASEVNRWVSFMKRTNPNPFKEFVKNLLLRGEAWYHPIHSERWVMGTKKEREMNRQGSPMLLQTPDPLTVYADPNEDENGIPDRVIVWYMRKPTIIMNNYPEWKNPEKKKLDEQATMIDWFEYWDKDMVQFEADGQIVHQAKNIYGFVPFVHGLSGFGKQSPDGLIEDLIVGRLRKSRDRLVRECAIVSDIDSTFHMFANRNIDVQPSDAQHEVPADFAEKYEMGQGKLHILPFGIEIKKSEELLPEPQMFEYYRGIQAEFELEDPLVMSGIAVGGTGRQQQMTETSAMRRYDTIVENTEHAASVALGLGLKMCNKIPTLCPTEYGLKKADIGTDTTVTIKLKADDPIEADRKATLGSRLYSERQIDLRTNLIKYQGYTQEETEDIITNLLVDKVTFESPEIAELMGLKLAEKAGLAEELNLLKQRRQQIEQSGQGGGQQPRGSEVQTAQGREMIDLALTNQGQRNPPDRPQ